MINTKDLFGFKVVILDIEGTTTPISFILDNLFPYVRKTLRSYLEATWDTEETQEDIRCLVELSEQDAKEGIFKKPIIYNKQDKESTLKSVIENVTWQMDIDRKSTALKRLQGHMWRKGYAAKEIEGYVYDDVLEALKLWKSLSIPVYIYSSGSIEAQKLIFGNSNYGDLTQYIQGNFDTTTGVKVETQSYNLIYEEVKRQWKDNEHKLEKRDVLFVTDNILEAQAADAAGIRAVLADRPGNKPLPISHKFEVVTSFSQLFQIK